MRYFERGLGAGREKDVLAPGPAPAYEGEDVLAGDRIDELRYQAYKHGMELS